MPLRLKAILIFAAFGWLAALSVILVIGTRPISKEAILMIGLAGLSAGLVACAIGSRVVERGIVSGLLLGAVTMLLAQIPFAILVIAVFSLIDPIPFGDILPNFGLLVSAGWLIASPFQIVAGGLAAWVLRLTHESSL